MARYIDADKIDFSPLKDVFDRARATVIIMGQPTADVVEVVRCKDCKHRHVPCRCALWCGSLDEKEYFVERGEDFYCAYGERKE